MPYHDGSYNGLAFGNGQPGEPKPKRISPSLRNILNEVERTEETRPAPDLYAWARQGVLLTNTAHTVIEGMAESHLTIWFDFTTAVFEALNKRDNLVWMLWGSRAQAYELNITNTSHVVIKTGHPSPLNRSKVFVGSNCFVDCNAALINKGYEKILW